MTTYPRVRWFLLALLLAVGTFAGRAYAGALHVRDDAHVLSGDDANRLRSVVSAAPFDARFVVTSEYPDAQDLSRYVHSLVTEPNVVVVGLDPQHHHVQVRFGASSHVSPAEWPAIERAGNEAFRRGDWAGGAAAIFQVASRAVGRAGEVTPAVGARPSLLGPGVLILIVIGAIGFAAYFAWKRSTYGSPGPPGYGPPGYGPGPYGGYPMGPPQGGGMGPLGGGLIGAGLGGLAGYELGKLEGEREGRERDPGWTQGQGGGADEGAGNFDEGGGGSSWDDDGGGFGGGDGGGGDGGGGGGADF